MCVCVCVCECMCVQLFAIPWTVAHQVPLSMGFSRQENWSGSSFPSAGDLPDPVIELAFLVSPALAAGSLPLVPLGRPHDSIYYSQICSTQTLSLSVISKIFYIRSWQVCVCVGVCVCVEVILLQWRKEKAREGREKKLFYATGKYTIWLCYVVLEVP